MSYGVACCSFAARAAGECSAPMPGRAAAIGQSGNSMHTEVSACILSFALLEVALDKSARRMFKVALERSLGNFLPMEAGTTQPGDLVIVEDDSDGDAQMVNECQ